MKRHSFFHDGAGKIRDYSYGVLRSNYSGQQNSTLVVAAQKLEVQPSDGEWRPARMAAVVLPRGVPDIYADPRAL